MAILKKLTDYQIQFLVDTFFKNEKYAGWKNIAFVLLEDGKAIVAGTECIWIGGIGNFIKTNSAKGFIDCLEYTFNLDEFLKSEWYKEHHSYYIEKITNERFAFEREMELKKLELDSQIAQIYNLK